ncbi:MAG: SIS domain-containing protein [Desulfonatronovibrionaceae bacterium]
MNEEYAKWLDIGRRVLETEIQGLKQVRQDLDEGFVRALEILAGCTGRIVISGVGKSGLVGRKTAATLSSTGTPSFFLHPVEGAHGDLGMIREEDVIIAISNSGETDELNAIMPAIKSLGTRVVVLTSNPDSSLGRMADAAIRVRVPREACPLGLAPTASTTAALAVGDALAVGLIEIKSFSKKDFQKNHPGGTLGQRLAMRVSDLMHRESLPVAEQGASLKEALDILNYHGLGTVLLTSEGRLKGILTDGDVRRIVCSGNLEPDRPVREYMTADPRKVTPETSAARAMDLMEEKAITVIPVVDGSEILCGLVHMHDLLGKGRLKFSRI